MTRVGAAPVRGPPPTMSKLSSTEINRLLLFSCSEVVPPSLSIARVGPSDSSPVTDTTALEFPSVSVPVETNPSLALLLCRPPLRSELQVVSKTLPSVGDPPAGLIAQRCH